MSNFVVIIPWMETGQSFGDWQPRRRLIGLFREADWFCPPPQQTHTPCKFGVSGSLHKALFSVAPNLCPHQASCVPCRAGHAPGVGPPRNLPDGRSYRLQPYRHLAERWGRQGGVSHTTMPHAQYPRSQRRHGMFYFFGFFEFF